MLKKFKYLITFFTLFFCLSVTSFAATEDDEGTDEGSIYHNIYFQEDGSLKIISENKVATSSIRAKTVGYTWTNQETGEQVTINLVDDEDYISRDTSIEYDSNGVAYYHTETTYTAEYVSELLASLGTSYSEITASGSTGFALRIDHIMAVSTDGGSSYSNKIEDFISTSPYATYVLSYLEKYGIDATTWDGTFNLYDEDQLNAFLTIFNWADADSWLTNWDKELFIGPDGKFYYMDEDGVHAIDEEDSSDPEDDPDSDTDTDDDDDGFIYQVWTGGTTGKSNAEVDYYNDSREYTDSDGTHVGFADAFDTDANGEGIIIPSSEKYLTGITAQTYTGTVGISMGETDHTFSYNRFTYTYVKTAFYYVEQQMTDENGDPMYYSDGSPIMDNYWNAYYSESHKSGYGQSYDSSFAGSTTRSANFIYISDLDLYDFSSATTQNETFTSGTQTFLNTDNHVLYDIDPEEDSNGDPIGPVDSGDISSSDNYLVSWFVCHIAIIIHVFIVRNILVCFVSAKPF